ncbi:MAG: hypothetical protein HYZ22_09525 [Chloroflexi bacterium]|nr:hypothetical protein [Chloroflexota bacterium]
MKRLLLVSAMLGMTLSACLPAFSQTQENSTPVSDADLQSTAAVFSQQTLQALPTATVLPSETPVIFTPSQTGTQPTVTETVNPVLLTLTATLLAGTATVGTQTSITGTPPTQDAAGAPSATNVAPTLDGSPQPLFYGTQPPNLPSGTLSLFNKSHVEVYISLRCVTKDGYVSIIEYPVKKNFNTSAPAGKYTYVAWVGGRQFDGSFTLDKDGFITITFFKDRINVKKN